tara:strand:+ start:1175 stop:1453 length:279 start_codon:yes stop_codon:yes gene_type:complete
MKNSAFSISPTPEHLGPSIVDELIAAGAKIRISHSRSYCIADARNMELVDVYNMETRERDARLRGGIEAWYRTTAERESSRREVELLTATNS